MAPEIMQGRGQAGHEAVDLETHGFETLGVAPVPA